MVFLRRLIVGFVWVQNMVCVYVYLNAVYCVHVHMIVHVYLHAHMPLRFLNIHNYNYMIIYNIEYIHVFVLYRHMFYIYVIC